jgi:tetratricopeptide (TPR) repeat protein
VFVAAFDRFSMRSGQERLREDLVRIRTDHIWAAHLLPLCLEQYNSFLMRRVLQTGLLATVLMAERADELSPQDSSYIETHFVAAKQAEQARDFGHAAGEYQEILKKFPKAVPEVYQNLGLVYYLARKYDLAIRTFSEGIRLKPEMVGARLFLGASYLISEQPQSALPHLQYAYQQKPAPETATYLGLAYTGLKQYLEAARYFRIALDGSDQKDVVLYFTGDVYLKASELVSSTLAEQNPDSKYDHFLTAKILDSQGWHQVAAKEYLAAAKREPFNASIFFPLGQLLAIFGQDAASELALRRYLQLVPLDSQAVQNRAELPKKEAADVGLKEDYVAELQSLPAVPAHDLPPLPLLDSDVNTRLREALASDRTGQWKAAVDGLVHGRWAEASAELGGIRGTERQWLRDYLLVASHAWAGQYEKAEEALRRSPLASSSAPAVELLRWQVYLQLSFSYFTRLLGEYPGSARAHFLKARTLDAQGKRDALAEYQAAIAADPGLSEARVALADHYLANAKYPEAMTECQKALETNPWTNAAKVRLGRIYVQLRRPAEGIPYLEDGLRVDPNDAQARVDLARGVELQGDMEKAIAEYQKALKLDPSLNRVHYVLGRIYRRQGKTDLADREYQVFQQNESSDRQKHLERVRRLRESQAPSREGTLDTAEPLQ